MLSSRIRTTERVEMAMDIVTEVDMVTVTAMVMRGKKDTVTICAWVCGFWRELLCFWQWRKAFG